MQFERWTRVHGQWTREAFHVYEKRCPRCQTVKAAEAFHRHAHKGLQGYCKACQVECVRTLRARRRAAKADGAAMYRPADLTIRRLRKPKEAPSVTR